MGKARRQGCVKYDPAEDLWEHQVATVLIADRGSDETFLRAWEVRGWQVVGVLGKVPEPDALSAVAHAGYVLYRLVVKRRRHTLSAVAHALYRLVVKRRRYKRRR